MNRIFAVVSSCFLFSHQMTGSAYAYIDRWSVTDSYTNIVVTDCGDCEEDLGIIIACTGNGQPAKVTVNAAAAENGQDGATAPVTFSIGGEQFVRQAKTIYFGRIGYTPEFQLSPNDPLISALQRGSVANISFNNGSTQIGLNGSRNALDTFKAHCGWTTPGYQINLARNSGQNTQQVQVPQNTQQLPVFSQQPTQQQQTQQLPVFSQQQPVQPAQQQPLQQVPQQQVQGQLPVFSQGQAQTQQQAQQTVYGVQPGQVHTQPNANGELWFTSASNTTRQLWYGIPETDAIAVSASCQPSSPQPISLDLLVGTGNLGNGQQARIEFLFDGQNPFGLDGTTFIENEEYQGVRVSIAPTAPFWGLLSSARSVSFGIQEQGKITIPGAGNAGQFFVSQCGASSAPTQQFVQQPLSQQPLIQQQVPQQPALQQPLAPQPSFQQQQVQQQPVLQQPILQQPVVQQQPVQQPQQQIIQQQPVQQQPQVAQQPSVEFNRTFTVTCASGASWKIRFENRQSKTVAILHPGLPQQLILEPVATPSGQGYRNGPLTVYPEGNQLRSDHQGNVSSCPMR